MKKFTPNTLPYNFLKHPAYLVVQFVVGLIFGFTLHWITSTLSFLPQINNYPLTGLAVALSIVLVAIVVAAIKGLRVQKIYNQPSWMWYAFFGLAISPIFAYLFSISDYSSLFQRWGYVPYVATSLAMVLIYIFVPKAHLNMDKKRFAPGAVGLNSGDRLDFASTAKNTATSIRKLKSYVEVLAIYGRMGDGKSSYARMLSEELSNDGTSLYTYISLTETNAAKDFSLLFAERWFDTLKEKYPKINPTNSLTLMKSILRETGHGWLSSAMDYIATFGDGILKTKTKKNIWDASLGYEPVHVSKEIGQIFGNINEIKEDRWIIVIDEIERAKFDEVYRVIEVIERFKAEGRSGLPTQLVFILCIDRDELTRILKRYGDTYPITQLIEGFFIHNPKSITLPLYLPLLDFGKKEGYILDQLDALISQFSISKDGLANPDTQKTTLSIYWAISLIVPISKFEADKKKVLDFTLNLLVEGSLRTTNRVIDKISQFYSSFLTLDGKPNTTAIRFSDVVLISYIAVAYPYLIDFFKETIYSVFYDENDTPMAFERAIIAGLKEDDDKKHERIADWVSRVTGVEIAEAQKSDIENLVALVCYRYVEYVSGQRQYQRSDLSERYDSLSLYDNLSDYLKNVSGTTTSQFSRNYPIYQQHQRKGLSADIHGETLIEYSSFLRRYEVRNSNLHLDVAVRIFEDLRDGVIKPEPKELRDTLSHKATYEFEFQILNALMANNNNPLIPKATSLFEDFLLCSSINTEAKITIIGGQINTDGSGSEIHQRLNDGFEKMLKQDNAGVRKAIRGVLKDFEQKYINKKESIYKYEGNFFYVLYQMWNGKVGDKTIKFWPSQLRTIASRGLAEDELALELHWSRWPFDPEWKTYKDYLESHAIIRERNAELYMPLRTLISITKKANKVDEALTSRMKFWERISKEQDFKNDMKLQDEVNTVRAKLLAKYQI